MAAIGGHHLPNRGITNDWLTPPGIIQALGPFDLDPCASVDQPWRTANQQYTIGKNGKLLPWDGMVWMNPPYGTETWEWLELLARHGNGIALIFARTETEGFFQHVWNKADALFFFKGRLHFHMPVSGQRAKGNAGAPSVLAAYGREAVARLKNMTRQGGIHGRFVSLVDHAPDEVI